eukprot:CAMPEP_0175757354 /NCGR_PEP_ID=MMETSP0097-20121207/64420_1 /TAXON_ID=311494 /ORGANISM="Alexandrium monilatum, Strain CCMP3105" /LENGTH=175 /DNA_ID=CAMNT_0017066533 /DNA_START=226 /DNA_END=750 /DNA_ORIENTATION=+
MAPESVADDGKVNELRGNPQLPAVGHVREDVPLVPRPAILDGVGVHPAIHDAVLHNVKERVVPNPCVDRLVENNTLHRGAHAFAWKPPGEPPRVQEVLKAPQVAQAEDCEHEVAPPVDVVPLQDLLHEGIRRASLHAAHQHRGCAGMLRRLRPYPAERLASVVEDRGCGRQGPRA